MNQQSEHPNPTGTPAGGRGGRRTSAPRPGGADTTPPAARKPRDWSWRHGPVWGTVNAAAALESAAMLGDLGNVSPLLAAGAGVAAAGGSLVLSARQNLSEGGRSFRLLCFLGAGSWGTWALASSAWSPDVVGALVAGAGALGLAAPAVARHEQAVIVERERRVQARQRQAVAREWEDRLLRVCRIEGARVTGVKTMESGGGYSMHISLPTDGTDWKRVAGFADQLAASAGLPEGCGVEARRATTRGAMILDVYTANALAKDWPYPVAGMCTLTVNEGLPIGRYRDLTETVIDLLDTVAIVIGQIGSGKTNLLQVVNAALARCVDVVLWHIDLNGGGMSSPWADEWLDDPTAPTPSVDWIATNVDEALKMTEAALAIAVARKRNYRARMREANDDKLSVDARVPEIVIVLDEGAEALGGRGNTKLAANIDQIVTTGRAMRVRVLFSGVRATGDVIANPNLKKQAGTKIAMNGTDDAEIAYLMEWSRGVSADDTVQPGDAHIQLPAAKQPRVFRSYRIKPDQIRQINTITRGHRPDLDDVSARAGGTTYAGRWDRYRTAMEADMDTPTNNTPHQNTGPEQTPGSMMADAQAALAARIAKMSDTSDTGDGQDAGYWDLDRELRELLATTYGTSPDPGAGAGESDPDSDARAATGRARMLAILREAGPAGLGLPELTGRLQVEGVAPEARQTLHRWLSEAMEAGHVRQVRRGVYATTDTSQ
jgi:hypothetical protein